jgi:hypothetical protein
MERNTLFGILGLLAIIGYILFYIGERRYLYENFQSSAAASVGAVTVAQSTAPVPVNSPTPKTIELAPVEVPYTKQPINGVDDYEYNLVYQNESDKALSQGLRNKLMSQRPMEWSGLPPSSSQFQAGLRESFENAKPTVPDSAKPYDNIAGNLMQPPDMSQVEKEEKKILQTYKPKFPPTPTTYDSRDVNELIQKVYDAKGVIPEVVHKEGTNVYEIVGVRRKDEKVVFEDEAVEADATEGPNKEAMESTVKAPLAVRDMNSPSKDAFFDEGSAAVEKKSRTNRWDYTAWTPGLERMFAPTKAQEAWY